MMSNQSDFLEKTAWNEGLGKDMTNSYIKGFVHLFSVLLTYRILIKNKNIKI